MASSIYESQGDKQLFEPHKALSCWILGILCKIFILSRPHSLKYLNILVSLRNRESLLFMKKGEPICLQAIEPDYWLNLRRTWEAGTTFRQFIRAVAACSNPRSTKVLGCFTCQPTSRLTPTGESRGAGGRCQVHGKSEGTLKTCGREAWQDIGSSDC